MGNGEGMTWTVNDIFAGAEQTNNNSNEYLSAVKKHGPPRCWFCRDATHARFFGCNTDQFAKAFAEIFLRGTKSEAVGTTRFVYTDGNGRAWFSTKNGPDTIQGGKHRTLPGLQSETKYWKTCYGK